MQAIEQFSCLTGTQVGTLLITKLSNGDMQRGPEVDGKETAEQSCCIEETHYLPASVFRILPCNYSESIL